MWSFHHHQPTPLKPLEIQAAAPDAFPENHVTSGAASVSPVSVSRWLSFHEIPQELPMVLSASNPVFLRGEQYYSIIYFIYVYLKISAHAY